MLLVRVKGQNDFMQKVTFHLYESEMHLRNVILCYTGSEKESESCSVHMRFLVLIISACIEGSDEPVHRTCASTPHIHKI